ncbi:MAG: HD domain-containing protein [Acidobacteriia bacterium]|nr:HD domain-containing protein [Terriglobia bacterium]
MEWLDWLPVLGIVLLAGTVLFLRRKAKRKAAIAVGDRIEQLAELAEGFNLAGENIQRYISDLKRASEENRQLFLDSIRMITSAVDAKDPRTKGHSGRVADYSVAIARHLKLPDEEVEKIRTGAELHDVGLSGIEDRILKKPSALTEEESEIMKRHTIIGYEMVRQIRQLNGTLPIIRWHHERLDGKGYPDGIAGDEIPLGVRIVAVAEAFDAMTSDRPYQAGRSFSEARDELLRHSGTQFDPEVVKVFLSIPEETWKIPPSASG